MVRAHSLLYAIYICLIVSIICGALLYFSTLYTQLNLHYNLREELYIQNQSYLNFALESNEKQDEDYVDPLNGVISSYENKPYGLLNVLSVRTFSRQDTVTSVLMTGSYADNKTCLFIAGQGNPFFYSGKVKLVGDKLLPTLRIEEKYIKNEPNSLKESGKTELAPSELPEVNALIRLFYEKKIANAKKLSEVSKHLDSIYFNSFSNETIEIVISGTVLADVKIKGNFILHAKDSLLIKNTAVLEDVIIKSPKITVEDHFRGSGQFFANDNIIIGKEVILKYPSAVCLLGNSSDKKAITIDENAKIFGAVVLLDDSALGKDKAVVKLKKGALLTGEVFCEGKLMVEGIVHGSVITRQIFHETGAAQYDNCMADSEIDVSKRPAYYVSVPVLENKNKRNNGVIKKIF